MTVAWPAEASALRPRTPAGSVDRAQALALLESERTVASALAIRAIAIAWDTGRISGADDGLPREHEALGVLGIRQGLAGDRVADAEAQLRAVITEASELERAIQGQRPLDELARDFELSPLAQKLLVLIAAPQLWGEVAQLYAIAANNPGRAIVDAHLLRMLLAPTVDGHTLAAELGPAAPLARYGLVHVRGSDATPFAALAVDPIVIARLRAEPLDVDPTGALDVQPPAPELSTLLVADEVAGPLAHELGQSSSRRARWVVRGRAGSGRRTLLVAVAARAHRRLAMLNLHRVADGGRAIEALRRELARCHLAGWIPCLDGWAGLADDPGVHERLRHAIAAHPGPLALRLEREVDAPIDPDYLLLEVPDLSETARLALWRRALTARGVDSPEAALGHLTARWRVGAGTLHRVVAHVTAQGGEPTAEMIDRAVGQHLERGLGRVAEKQGFLPRLADMVLPTDIMDSMTEFVARLRLHRHVFETWGMSQVASTGRGLTALFQGPPGTGKTMVAGALARELGIDLYRVDLSRVMSKWIGETERNLGEVFSAAEQSQAIILFDEADSLFGKRTEVKSSNDRFANLEVNYLLQRLDSFVGVAILTTNLATAIDPAFRRRLTFRVQFPIPDEDQREQLWRAHLPPSLPTSALDLTDLARRYPLTGGSVRNCVLRATFLAAAEQAMLTQDHLVRAILLEYRAAGKLSESGPLE